MCYLEEPRDRSHALSFARQGDDKGASQARTAKSEPIDEAAHEYEGTRLTCFANCFPQWCARNPFVAYSGQLRKKLLFVADVLLDSAGYVIDCSDDSIVLPGWGGIVYCQ